MTRQTIVSLLVAAMFGAVMAGASMASGEPRQGGWRPHPQDACYPTYAACVARCAPTGSAPEQQARCQSQCAAQMDPMDCQYLRQPLSAAPNHTVQGTTQRQ